MMGVKSINGPELNFEVLLKAHSVTVKALSELWESEKKKKSFNIFTPCIKNIIFSVTTNSPQTKKLVWEA